MSSGKETEPVRFACDAMLGGLARWLRAAGYDASWRPDIDDWDLIRLARREGRLLMTTDTGIFRIGIVRDGDVPGLLLPQGLCLAEQLAWVINRLNLPLGEPRCMTCGGELAEVPKETVRDHVPPRSFAWMDQFFACTRCGKVFWHGTHWQRIAARLEEIGNRALEDGPAT